MIGSTQNPSQSQHTFHIPVMGTGFTVDSPLRVARYGISSVISIADDTMLEDLRRQYAVKYGEPYTPIHKYDDDWRAHRITEYLNWGIHLTGATAICSVYGYGQKPLSSQPR